MLVLVLCAALCGLRGACGEVEGPGADQVGHRLVEMLAGTDGARGGLARLQQVAPLVPDRDHAARLLLQAASHNTSEIGDPEGDREHERDHLYLQIKRRLNRDDVARLLAESGRRGGEAGPVASGSKLDGVLDRLLAAPPTDLHVPEPRDEDHVYWDPEEEVSERATRGAGGRRLYRGERTTVRYYPFMVSVHVMGRFWCGGVIYSRDLVLTSAACLQLLHNNRFFRENPRVLSVRLGSNHSRLGGEMVDALEVYFHPGYNPRTLAHNLAVVRLRRHIHFGRQRVPKCIALADLLGPPAPTAEVLLLGWGVKKSSQKISYEPVFLQSKLLPVYPNVFCKEVYGDKFVTQSMFCAGTMSTGEGACDHDAGGPAVSGGKLAGIISFGPTVCGFPNAPTVFTLIGPYIDWIESVQEAMPHYYRGHKRTTVTEPPYEPVSMAPALLDEEGNFLHVLSPVVERHGEDASSAPPTPSPGPGPSPVPVPSSPRPPPHVLRKRKPKKDHENPLDVRGSGYLSINL